MDKKLAVILSTIIISEHNKNVCEKYDTAINLDAAGIDYSINTIKAPFSEVVKKNLLNRIAIDMDREYTVMVKCQVGEENGYVTARFDLDKHSGKKFHIILKELFEFSDNLSDSACDKIRCLVMKTTGFTTLYM